MCVRIEHTLQLFRSCAPITLWLLIKLKAEETMTKWLILLLHLIGWEVATCLLDQSQSAFKANVSSDDFWHSVETCSKVAVISEMLSLSQLSKGAKSSSSQWSNPVWPCCIWILCQVGFSKQVYSISSWNWWPFVALFISSKGQLERWK